MVAHRLDRIGHACFRPFEVCGKFALIVVPTAALLLLLVYVRLHYSPISVAFLAEPIERALNAELRDYSVGIGGAVLHLSERRGVELRMRNLQVFDSQGGRIAQASWAGVEIDLSSLLALRIAPARIALIEPRIVLATDAQGRISMRVEGQDGDTAPAPGPATTAPGPRAPNASVASGPPDRASGVSAALPDAPSMGFDLGRVIADAMDQMRRSGDSGATLEGMGLRNAIVVVDTDGHQTTWRVPSLDVDLTHKQKRRIVSGTARIASTGEPWRLGFRIEASEKKRTISVTTEVGGLVPRALVGSFPGLAILEALDIPIAATGAVELTMEGTPTGGQIEASLGAGRLNVPWFDRPLDFEQGTLTLGFDGATRRIDLAPSSFAVGGRRLTLAGSAEPDADPAAGWRWHIGSVNEQPTSVPLGSSASTLEHVSLRGRVGGGTAGASIEHAIVRMGGSELVASGTLGNTETGPAVDLTGRFSTMPVDAIRALWPTSALSTLHAAAINSFVKGTITGRHFRLTSQPTIPGEVSPGLHFALTLEGQDLELEVAKGLPLLEVPRLLVRLEGSGIEATAPDAHMSFPGGRRVGFKGARLTTVAVPGAPPLAELAVRAQGTVPAFIDLLDREPFAAFKGAGPPIQGLDGKVDAQVRVTLPLKPDVLPADLRLEARTRITDGRVKNLMGAHDISGATITIDATERAADIKGELLLAGVVVKVGGQWQASPPDGRQAPVKFTTRLDSAYRAQLGLDIDHMVSGDVPIEITLQTGAGEHQLRVSADLTSAELSLADLAWKKPSGHPAKLEFDVGKGTVPKSLELQNFRITGQNIAIEGSVGLGPDAKIREYSFPEFSLNVVTNLAVRGRLRQPERVWDVVARGKTFDAQELFRSFFTFGGETKAPTKNRPGVDLDAEIDTVLGANDATLRRVRLRMQERAERVTSLEMTGVLEGGQTLTASLRPEPNRPRLLQARSADAGQALKLIGLYPNMLGGSATLDVNLDGRGPIEKTGQIRIRKFFVLGDPIVSEVLQNADNSRPAIDQAGRHRRVVREQFEFEHLVATVSVGNGQMALEDVIAKGPLIGASLRGKIDFRSRRLQLGGTYVPLSGINRALSDLPLIGLLLTGPRGEGVFGITFAVDGPIAEPNVVVNPFSLVTIGVLREIFQMAPDNPKITPKAEPKPVRGGGPQVRASPPTPSSSATARPPGGETGVLDGWAAQAKVPAKKN